MTHTHNADTLARLLAATTTRDQLTNARDLLDNRRAERANGGPAQCLMKQPAGGIKMMFKLAAL